MGNTLSTSSTTAANVTALDAATQARLSMNAPPGRRSISRNAPSHSEPLFLGDVKAEPAKWSQEGVVVTLQRLFGWLPDSTAEQLKQAQSHPYFFARSLSHGGGYLERQDAVLYVQRFFRHYRRIQIWQSMGNQMLVVARCNLEDQRTMEETELTVANFRMLLMQGFSAHKVSISGVLKNIHLKLVLNAQSQECYLTWTPSRKRHPRIHLHDVQEVVPVLAENNTHEPKLANKLSHRRGLIILSKSHHRGRMLLELGSKRERNLLLRGFKLLLEEINASEPNLDHAGALRKRIPRRQSVLEFFDREDSRLSSTPRLVERKDSRSSGSPRSVTFEDEQPMMVVDSAPASPARSPLPSPARRRSSAASDLPNATSIAHFYKTRFDEPEESSSSKSSLVQPASTAAM